MKKIIFFLLYFFPILLNVSIVSSQQNPPVPLAEGLMQDPTACLASLTTRSWPPVRHWYSPFTVTKYGGAAYQAARSVACEKIMYDSSIVRYAAQAVSWAYGGVFDEKSWDDRSQELARVHNSVAEYGKKLAGLRSFVSEKMDTLATIYAQGAKSASDFSLLKELNNGLKNANDTFIRQLEETSKAHRRNPSVHLERFAPLRDSLEDLQNRELEITRAESKFFSDQAVDAQQRANREKERAPFYMNPWVTALSKNLKEFRINYPGGYYSAASVAGLLSMYGLLKLGRTHTKTALFLTALALGLGAGLHVLSQ